MPKLKSFLNIFKQRRLQVDILSVFLFVVAASSLFIISYTYSKNSKSILQFSKTTIERISAVILGRINDLIEDVQQPPKAASGLFIDKIDISESDQVLSSFLLAMVKAHEKITSVYIGTPNGNMIEAVDLRVAGQTHYQFNPSKPLPEGSIYGLRYVLESSSPSTEKWYYKDENFKTIGSESRSPSQFNTLTRPWYKGASDAHELFWTDIYLYDPTYAPGITVAKPVYSSSTEQLIGVIGSDLSLALFSSFLANQQIGNTGKAFILSKSTGKILIPVQEEDLTAQKPPALYGQLANEAYKIFLKNHQIDFLFVHNDVEYLSSVHTLPISAGNEWLIVIIAPLQDFFSDILKTQKQVVLISTVIFVLAGLLVVYFAKRISAPITTLAHEVDKIQQLELDSNVRVKSNIKEISMMDASIASMRSALRSFARYVPKPIVRQLIQKGQEIVLGGEKKEITILFSDIVGFTAIVETLSTDIVMPLLSEYFDALSKVIIECDGTIDKYIGDSIMAFWGAPQEILDHPTKACIATLLCQSSLFKLNKQRKEEGKPEFYTRFGINTGTVIVGNIGTSERINYTVMGDAVNTASRLQLVNNVYHTDIIISEEVYKKIGDLFLTRPLDIVTIRGKKEKIKIYELIAIKQGYPSILPKPEQVLLCSSFTAAYEAFYRGDLKKAKELFEAIREQFPGDFPTQLYLERIEKNGAG